VSDVPAVVRIKNELVSANTYILRGGASGSCVLIDPGSDIEAIEGAMHEHGLTPTAIYCTHGHFDHIGSAEQLRRRYSIPVYLDPADVKVARSSNFRMLALKLSTRITIPEVFTPLDAGISGEDGIDVVPVPGHTPGSVALLCGGYAFTGDTLYRDETWRMSWPEEDGGRLVASVRELWEFLPDETVVYPGHGGAAAFGSIKLRNLPMRRMLGLDEVAVP
jgi:hydroxyacylglutathione hydrolase